MIRIWIIYNFNKQIAMAKRQSWSSEEDKLISSFISVVESENRKIKWAQVSLELKQNNPDWKRKGKQCRERWLNHLRPCLNSTEDSDHIDLQLLFKLIRVHGKKWSLIAKEMPGRTDNAIKNFFYAALRKGLRNLNLYNTEIRSKRIYKHYKHDLIDKLLSVHDEKKNKDLFISNSSVFELAEDIRENFIKCSKDELKASSELSDSLEKFYENLNENVTTFCRSCKFRKSKGKQQGQLVQKYKIAKSFNLALPILPKIQIVQQLQNQIKLDERSSTSVDMYTAFPIIESQSQQLGFQSLAENLPKKDLIKYNYCLIQESDDSQISNQSIFSDLLEKQDYKSSYLQNQLMY